MRILIKMDSLQKLRQKRHDGAVVCHMAQSGGTVEGGRKACSQEKLVVI